MDRQVLSGMELIPVVDRSIQQSGLYHWPPQSKSHCQHLVGDRPVTAKTNNGSAGSTAYIIMALTPLCFSTNLIFGRGVTDDVAPFTLAFLRWSAVAVILSPLVWREADRIAAMSAPALARLAVLGFLGMWICGAIVYVALDYTTATNATLLYTTSAVMIIVLEALFYGRRSGWREAVGVILAIVGVLVIVVKGTMTIFLSMSFNIGDLMILGTAFSWALYSVLQRQEEIARLPNLAIFGLVAGVGAIMLLPFAAYEFLSDAEMPRSGDTWLSIGGIILFASLLAFSGFQYGVRTLSPSLAGIFMYLMPVYGVALAILFLNESLSTHHIAGGLLVFGGVVLATLPKRIESTQLAERRK